MSSIQQEYESRLAALSPCERVERSVAMFHWCREIIARQILSERGPMNSEQLKWEVALRQYGDEPAIREMIEGKLASVSD